MRVIAAALLVAIGVNFFADVTGANLKVKFVPEDITPKPHFPSTLRLTVNDKPRQDVDIMLVNNAHLCYVRQPSGGDIGTLNLRNTYQTYKVSSDCAPSLPTAHCH